jgi:predicted transcriptional regulator
MNNEVIDPHLTTKIVSSYVRYHAIGAEQVSELITSVHRALTQLGQPIQPEQVRTPAVSVRQSVRHDRVVCLDCGFTGKTLHRHIRDRHGLSRDEYLKRWGLRRDHLLTAPAYSEQRSTMAKEVGLGRKPKAPIAPPAPRIVAAPPVDADVETQKAPARGQRSRSRSKQMDAVDAVTASAPVRKRRPRS